MSKTPLGAFPGLAPVFTDLEIRADLAAALEAGPLAFSEGAGDGAGAAAGEAHVAEGAHLGVGLGWLSFGRGLIVGVRERGLVALLGSRTFVTCLFS
jgi:hypothetical protein